MFGSSEDRARQLAGRARRARLSSSGTHGSWRTPSGSSQSSMPPLTERQNQHFHGLGQQPAYAPGQLGFHNQRRVHTLPAKSLPQLPQTPLPNPVRAIDTQLPPTWTYASPALTYFEWDDSVRETKKFPLWNEPINSMNSPGFGTLYNNLSDPEKRRFLFECHGNPWGPLSDALSATGKRTWFQSLSPGNQATFKRVVRYRQNAVQNAGPHAPVQHNPKLSRPSMMLWEALEAIETRYASRVTYTDGSSARLPLRSASSPVLSTAGDGATDLRSFSTYWNFCLLCLDLSSRISFCLFTVVVDIFPQILHWRRWRRGRVTCGQEYTQQVVRRLSRRCS